MYTAPMPRLKHFRGLDHLHYLTTNTYQKAQQGQRFAPHAKPA
jgi:hypothetical protein